MEPPSQVSIYAWCKTFERVWCVCKGKNSGLHSASEAITEPIKSTRLASLVFQPLKTNASKVLRKRLYKHQLVQALQPEDFAVRHEFKGQKLARAEVLTNFHKTHILYYSSIINIDRRQTMHMEL
jgi:hypothetical protein